MAGQIEDIPDIDSLRKVREVFNSIRSSYRKLKQNVDAMQRQIESDPNAIQKMKHDKQEESKGIDHSMDDSLAQDPDKHQKRKPIDKQQAFIEYKDIGDGKQLERAVIDYRSEMKDKKMHIKVVTATLNQTKLEMDRVKQRLDVKGEEKKAQLKHGLDYQQDDDEGFGSPAQVEDIIDEEELMLLKEMKDLKKSYRENYDKLKNLKGEVEDIQTNIDNYKQQLILNFEQWYAEEFEAGVTGLEEAEYNQTLKQQYQQKGQMSTYKGDSLVMGGAGEDLDDDALAFIRAKKNVDSLHKAKRLEKQRPGRVWQHLRLIIFNIYFNGLYYVNITTDWS